MGYVNASALSMKSSCELTRVRSGCHALWSVLLALLLVTGDVVSAAETNITAQRDIFKRARKAQTHGDHTPPQAGQV